MSCQQAPKIIPTSTITSTRTREDPYIFSDNLPSAPLVSFHIQKPRKANTPIRRVTPKKLPLAQLNGLVAQHAKQQQQQQQQHTQASVTITAAGHGVNIKNAAPVIVSKQQTQCTSKQATNPSNVCIVRPQQQSTPQPQQQQQQNYHFQKLQIVQKPLYTQLSPPPAELPTPSLWHTPLIISTIESPPTSPASLPSPTANFVTDSCAVSAGCAPSSSLPPSNFLHTTFAQHLQKVGCISRKTPGKPAIHAGANVCTPQSSSVASAISQVAAAQEKGRRLANVESLQHSDTELNEIPVNVIYRSPPKLGATLKPQLAVLAQQKLQDVVVRKEAATPTLSTPPPLSIATNAALNALPNADAFLKQKALSLSQWGVTIQKTCATTTPTSSSSGGNNNSISRNQTLPAKPEVNKPAVRLPLVVKKLTSAKKQAPQRQTPLDVERLKPLLEPPNLAVAVDANSITTAAATAQLSPALKHSDTTPAICSAEPIRGFAVVTLPQNDSNTESPSPDNPPFILQKNWLRCDDVRLLAAVKHTTTREERIAEYKSQLLRQARQLQSVKCLQLQPLKTMRKRLQSVQNLLCKHKHHNVEEISQPVCQFRDCLKIAVPLAKYCFLHIFSAADQQLFQPCSAKLSDNTQCGKPTFDIVHPLPLCNVHWHSEQPQKQMPIQPEQPEQQPQQTQQQANSLVSMTKTHMSQQQPQQQQQRTIAVKAPRKRKPGSKPLGRPQKRCRKTAPAAATLSLASKQRKNSSTSLESIMSSSHSSQSQSFNAGNAALAVPALAPLSKFNLTAAAVDVQQHKQQQQPMENASSYNFSGLSRFTAAAMPEAHEFNRICAEYAKEASNNNNNNSLSKQLTTTSIDTIADDMLLNVCENSSAYASSEDTGFGGGLSETEPMASGQIDDIGGISLEENELTSVLNTLPMDAFNEFFTNIRTDDIERVLGIVDDDKMETGSTDFLEDLLHANDNLLDDAVDLCNTSILHSPETSGIETATLFADAGSNSEDYIGSDYGDVAGMDNNKTSLDGVPTAVITDIVRDLVQA